tara:strand:+ start:1358 stop:2056 length:699 start_codon:yes stop_codon:yes gene_type:complete
MNETKNEKQVEEVRNEQQVTQGYLLHAIYAMVRELKQTNKITISKRGLRILFAMGFLIAGLDIWTHINQYKESARENMHNEANHTISNNVYPINLKRYVGVATEAEWHKYLLNSYRANADQPIKAILSLDEVVKMKSVAKLIKDNEREKLEAKNIELELAVSQSKLNALLAWYWDDPKYLESVDYSHLNDKWAEGFSLGLKEAPKVMRHLFDSQDKLTNLNHQKDGNAKSLE